MAAQELGDIDQQIAVARASLSAMNAEKAQLQNQIKGGNQSLESQIHQSINELKREQASIRAKIQTNSNETYKLQQKSAAQGTISRERNDLLKKLGSELQEESEKLKALEVKLSADRVKADKVK